MLNLKNTSGILVHLMLIISCAICLSASCMENPDSLLRLVAIQKDCPEKADNLLLLTQHYLQSNPDTALLICEEAIKLSKRLAYQKAVAEALYKKSMIYKNKGEVNTAITLASGYLALCDSLKDSIRLAKAYYHIGNLTRKSSQNLPVLDYYRRSIRLFSALKDTIGLLANYNSLGIYFQEKSDFDSAAIYLHRSIDLCERIGRQKSLGKIFGNLGKVYGLLGDSGNARKYLMMGLDYDRKYADLSNMASNYTKLGNLEFQLQDYYQAMYYYILADSMFRKTNDVRGIHDIHQNFGSVYQKQGNYGDAIKHFNQALTYYREQNIAEGMIASWLGKALVYSGQDRYELALIHYDSCLKMAASTGDLFRRRDILQSISTTHYTSGNYQKAYVYLALFHDLNDSIFNLEKSEIINDLMLKYEKGKDQTRILTLENENLSKDLSIRHRTNQRNIYLFTGSGIIALFLLLLIFLRYQAKKNSIIARQRIIQLEEEKKLLAARFLIEGEENERKRIAAELHDGLGVLLSVTRMQFSAIKDPGPDNKSLIEKATEFLEQATGDVRRISHNMMPGLLTKLGLYDALEDLLEKISETENIEVLWKIKGTEKRLPENKEIMIYRIIQEMINNTLKHAEADKIWLFVEALPGHLEIRYADNGKGFEADEQTIKKSIGLQSIWSRIRFLDGTISLETSHGNGSRYTLKIPVSTSTD